MGSDELLGTKGSEKFKMKMSPAGFEPTPGIPKSIELLSELNNNCNNDSKLLQYLLVDQ